jgi:hypothetical protein
MKQVMIGLLTAAFAIAPAYAQEKKAETKPTMEQCKKDPKIKGCDVVLKKEKRAKKGGC